MNNLTTFYLVRHGQTEWNEKGIVQGQLDSPLTKKGVKQAKDLGEKLKGIDFDLVYSSDLLRAKRTAEIVNKEHKLEITTNKLLRERHFGTLQGTSEEEWKKDFENLTNEQKFVYKHNPEYESDSEISARLITALREIAIANPGKKILVVIHGGIIRTFLYKLGVADYDSLPPGSVKNTAFVKLESDGVDFFVKEMSGVQFATS